MTTNVRAYTLKIWLSSVVLSPLIMLASSIFIANTNVDNVFILAILFFFGALLSIPSIILLNVCCSQLITRSNGLFKLKVLLTGIGILLTYAPLWALMGFKFNIYDLQFFWPYFLTIVAGIWFFKLKVIKANEDEKFNT